LLVILNIAMVQPLGDADGETGSDFRQRHVELLALWRQSWSTRIKKNARAEPWTAVATGRK